MHLTTLLPVALATMVAAQNSTMSLVQVLAANNKTLSTLSSLLAAQPALTAALTSAKDITILAPSNDAFSKVLSTTAGKALANDPGAIAALLHYHVLNGTFPASSFTTTAQFLPTLLTNATFSNVTGGQVVQAQLSGKSVEIFTGLKEKSTVQTADVGFSGGVVHVVDTVLTVPLKISVSAVDSQLTALAGALTKVNLVSTVENLKDVTVFAPSNAAFEAIGSATGSLTDAQLAGILEYHVINNTVGYSSLLTTGLANETLPSITGAGLNIEAVDGKVFVDSAQVVITDIIVANGVMHVIDNVLNPSNTTATPNPTATTQAIAFAGASSAASVPFTSGITATTTAPSASKTGAAGRLELRGEGKVGQVGVAMMMGMGVIAAL